MTSLYWKSVATFSFALLQRDFHAQTRRLVLGSVWYILKPLVTLGAFTLVFHFMFAVDTGEVSYIPFALVGVCLWQAFSEPLVRASQSLLNNSILAQKNNVPRIAFPCAATLHAWFFVILSYVFLVVVLLWMSTPLAWAWLATLPLLTILALFVLGLSLGFCALVVYFRDIHMLLPFGLQFLLLVSPVGYSASALPASWRLLATLNPISHFVDAQRLILLHATCPSCATWALLATMAILSLAIGGLLFWRLNPFVPELL